MHLAQDKSLDDLISEKVKSVKSKGVRVGGQSNKIKIQRQTQKQQNNGNKNNNNRQQQQQKVHALDRALEVKNKKIGKQQQVRQQGNSARQQQSHVGRQQGHQNQQRAIRGPPPFPAPPPEMMMALGMMPGAIMAPLSHLMTGRLSGLNLTQNNRGGRGIGPGPSRTALSRPDPDGPAKWKNDLYKPLDMGPPKRGKPAGVPAVQNSRLRLSNLHYGVSIGDIKDLFSSAGPLKAYDIDYDAADRSLGTGMVEYYDAATAERALFQFNHVALDGQKLEIAIDNEALPSKLRSGIKVDYGLAGEEPKGYARLFKNAMGGPRANQGWVGGGDQRMGVPQQLQMRMKGQVNRMAAADAMQE